ncbi:MAG: lysozyme [Burkholderiaceae bacterium]
MAENRLALVALALSAAALVGLAIDEGYSSKAYPDPVRGAAVPTIGFGTTQGVKMGDTTTPVAALRRKLADLQTYEGALKRCVKVPLHQHEYDAYINLSYNIGPAALCNSKIVSRLNALDYAGACDAILMWKKSDGIDCSAPGNRICPGLWQRRLRLRSQCLGEATAGARP